MKPTAHPRFGKGVKLRHDGNGSVMLLIPEGALVLNAPAAAALELVDGARPLAEIITAVAAAIRRECRPRSRGYPRTLRAPRRAWTRAVSAEPRPLSLLCELTYRCNLQCPYCYNPLDLRSYRDELTTEQWGRVLRQAADLGVVQAHFSGGEPTLRPDLVALVEAAAACGLYTNLITQGTFLDDALLDRLVGSGLDHVQISIQAPQASLADRIAGATVHDKKLEALRRVLSRDVALTLNCVLHRLNHDSIEDVIEYARRLEIRRLELANVQFYGWAYRNRTALMPTLEQVRHGEQVVAAARERLRGTMEIVYVLPDYFGDFPKPCMNGWGRQFHHGHAQRIRAPVPGGCRNYDVGV